MATGAVGRFLELVGVELPVVNAPMGGVAGGALAAAVTAAGGLGFIGGGYGDLAWVDRELDAAAGRRVGVGFITWAVPDLGAAIAHVVGRGVSDVFLSFGDPSPHVPTIHGLGARAWCQVQDLDAARRAIEAGAEVLVAQGSEAGGHGRDRIGRDQILPEVIAMAADRPVLAAGGIGSPADAQRAIHAGAAGVVLGTRLYASHEALDTAPAKQELVRRTAAETVRTSAFDVLRGPEWPEGFDGRAVRNDTVREWEADEAGVRAQRSDARARYKAAVAADDMTRRVVWAGTSIDAVDAIEPAADIVRRFAGIG